MGLAPLPLRVMASVSPLHTAPRFKSTWSPALSAAPLTLARLRHAAAGDVPAFASLPLALSTYNAPLTGGGVVVGGVVVGGVVVVGGAVVVGGTVVVGAAGVGGGSGALTPPSLPSWGGGRVSRPGNRPGASCVASGWMSPTSAWRAG